MNKNEQSVVKDLSHKCIEQIVNEISERPDLIGYEDTQQTVATLEIARQLAMLTDEVRKLVAMQTEAMDMAKGMMAMFMPKIKQELGQ